jgi:fructose-1,6-bisphosphatase/inositol monophosphatase family enzyme
MREAANRAAHIVRTMRFSFESTIKPAHDGTLTDLVTSADRAAQEAIVRVLRDMTPHFGIIAEEAHLRVEPEAGDPAAYSWTVDPLDGTKAFGRMQSHGIAVMIALINWADEVIAACIVDVMTGEMYYTRPGSPKVHRMDHTGAHLRLDLLDPTRPLADQYLLVRKNPWKFPVRIRRCLIPGADVYGSLFKDFEIEGGSIGLSFARLWKGEVGGVLLTGDNPNLPWDWAPVVGLSQRLGYVFLRLEPQENSKLIPLPFTIETQNPQAPGCPILVVHKTHMDVASRHFHKSYEGGGGD